MNLNKSGIYYIKCLVNNKIYIGQSKNIRKRFNVHKFYLRNDKNGNPYLQSAWNKYGENNFEFVVIEFCNEEILSEKEIYYIEKYKSMYNENGYNICPGGHHCSVSEETKKKMSKSHTKNAVLQFDLHGNLINKWENIKEFSTSIGKTKEIRSISECCQKNTRRKTYLGYIWLFENDYIENGLNLEYYLNRKHIVPTSVVQIDKNNNFINEYKSIYDAASKTNIKQQNIQRCCAKKCKTAGGFKWIYKEQYYNLECCL